MQTAPWHTHAATAPPADATTTPVTATTAPPVATATTPAEGATAKWAPKREKAAVAATSTLLRVKEETDPTAAATPTRVQEETDPTAAATTTPSICGADIGRGRVCKNREAGGGDKPCTQRRCRAHCEHPADCPRHRDGPDPSQATVCQQSPLRKLRTCTVGSTSSTYFINPTP